MFHIILMDNNHHVWTRNDVMVSTTCTITNLFSFQFIDQMHWIAENFPKDRRYESLIAKSDNILEADDIKYVWESNKSCK